MKTPEIYPSILPPLKPRPPADDHTPEGTFILLFNEAVELATIHNDEAVKRYLKQCEYWQINAERYAWAKSPAPPKPMAPLGWIIKNVDADPFGPDGPRAVEGKDLLAGPCPDLEPDGTTVHPIPVDPVGDWFGGWDPWYRVLPGDVTPIGRTLSLLASPLHPAGSYTRRERQTPFGGFQYFEKVS